MGWLDGAKEFFNFIKPAAEVAIPAAVNYWGAKKQSDIYKKSQEKEDRRWQEYMNTINPPQDVLDTRYAQAKSQIVGSAPTARRRLETSLASRGIRGKGASSPIAGQNDAIQSALNQAYFDVYGDHNVPGGPGPSSVAPSTGELYGINTAQLFNYLYPYYYMNR